MLDKPTMKFMIFAIMIQTGFFVYFIVAFGMYADESRMDRQDLRVRINTLGDVGNGTNYLIKYITDIVTDSNETQQKNIAELHEHMQISENNSKEIKVLRSDVIQIKKKLGLP